jgi:hypothetical protein
MKLMRFNPGLRVAALLFAGAFGCGLLSSDITKVTFDLPTKHYTFMPPGDIPAVAVPCGNAALPACPSNGTVTVSCDNSVCTAHIPVTTSKTINLKMEVPQLQSVNSQTLADITLESMSYTVVNSTAVVMPAIDLYLAPADVMDPSGGQKFGTVPSIPANSTMSGDVIKEPGADALFIQYGKNFGTPFNFIATTNIAFPSGTPVHSTDMVDITITGKVAAQLSL